MATRKRRRTYSRRASNKTKVKEIAVTIAVTGFAIGVAAPMIRKYWNQYVPKAAV